jgi:hypothetical protein
MFSSVARAMLISGSQTVYLEGIDLEGGTGNGCLQITTATGPNIPIIYGKNCTFKYCRDANGVTLTGGFTYFENCIAESNGADGFNYHYHAATGVLPYAVEINCTGRYNGMADDNDNGSSIHDGGSIVRINGIYHDCNGPVIHDISNGTTSWSLGCSSHDSTNVAINANWKSGATGSTGTKMWLDCCDSYGSDLDIIIEEDSFCYIKDFQGQGNYEGEPTPY